MWICFEQWLTFARNLRPPSSKACLGEQSTDGVDNDSGDNNYRHLIIVLANLVKKSTRLNSMASCVGFIELNSRCIWKQRNPWNLWLCLLGLRVTQLAIFENGRIFLQSNILSGGYSVKHSVSSDSFKHDIAILISSIVISTCVSNK